MKHLTLNNDKKIPQIGLATEVFAEAGKLYRAIRWALKTGYRYIDCSTVYNNQSEVGQAVNDAIKENDIKREEIFISAKLWNDAHSPEDVIPALKQTLQELNLDYLDLYLVHWPVAQRKGTLYPQSDYDMLSLSQVPLELTWAEMERAEKSGLASAIGVANFGLQTLNDLIAKSAIVPAVLQAESQPFWPEEELIDFCRRNMIVFTAYSPFGDKIGNPNLVGNPVIDELAYKNRISPEQLLISWQINRGVAVLVQSLDEKHLQDDWGAQYIELDSDDMTAISSLSQNPHRYYNTDCFAFGDYKSEAIIR